MKQDSPETPNARAWAWLMRRACRLVAEQLKAEQESESAVDKEHIPPQPSTQEGEGER